MIWEVAASIDEQGWLAELAIPFKSLPFDPNIDTWGFNFGRGIRRRGEEMAWVSRNRSYNPSILGLASGLEGMDQGVGLDIVPSVSASNRRDIVLSATDSNFDPSLDVFYRLTPSLNASLTINTDFSATEVDDRQVNLTRFGLFFPEKTRFLPERCGPVRIRPHIAGGFQRGERGEFRTEPRKRAALLLPASGPEFDRRASGYQLRGQAQRPHRALEHRHARHSAGRVRGHRRKQRVCRPRNGQRTGRIGRRDHRHGRRSELQSRQRPDRRRLSLPQQPPARRARVRSGRLVPAKRYGRHRRRRQGVRHRRADAEQLGTARQLRHQAGRGQFQPGARLREPDGRARCHGDSGLHPLHGRRAVAVVLLGHRRATHRVARRRAACRPRSSSPDSSNWRATPATISRSAISLPRKRLRKRLRSTRTRRARS